MLGEGRLEPVDLPLCDLASGLMETLDILWTKGIAPSPCYFSVLAHSSHCQLDMDDGFGGAAEQIPCAVLRYSAI